MKTRSTNLRVKLTLGVACILTLSGAVAGVYDDAKAVFVGNGGGTSGANVRPTTCTWRDVRHAADPTAATHANMTTCGVTPNYVAAYDNTIVYSNSDVNCLSAGLTLANEPVLYFNHKFRKEGETRYHTPNILNLGWTFPKNEYTILMRFKPEEPIGMTSTEGTSDNTGVALFSVQGTWQKSGYNFGYCPNAAGTGGALKVFGYGAVHSGNASGIRAMTVTNEVWHELAVTVSDKIMTVYLAKDPDGLGQVKRTSVTKDWSPHTSLDWFTPEQDKTIVVGGSANTIAEKSDMTGNSFRGMIHMMAFWDRALTQAEINEAFSQGRPSVMRIGYGGAAAGSDQFAGAGGSLVTLSSANPWAWREFPTSLVKDATVTVPFVISERDAGYGQFLRVFGDATSGRGSLTVGLDGVNLGGLSIGPGDDSLFIPGTALSSGAHTLTVTRSDAGEDVVKLGSLSIEGSWCYKMVGKSSPVTDSHAVTPVTDGYIGSVRKSLNQGEVNSQSFTFTLDEKIKAMGKLVFHLKLESSRSLVPSDMRVTLNGNAHSYENIAYNGEIVMKLPVSELKVGENVVKVSCFDTETNWPSIERYALEATGLRNGFLLIFR